MAVSGRNPCHTPRGALQPRESLPSYTYTPARFSVFSPAQIKRLPPPVYTQKEYARNFRSS
jgi:hypothetical protein